MNNDVPTYSKLVDLALGLLAGLVLWFSKRSVTKFDRRIEVLERDAVRVASLKLMREQLSKEHEENSARLDRIEGNGVRLEGQISSVHSRVDDVFKMMVRLATGNKE
jgi:hypothetical protein